MRKMANLDAKIYLVEIGRPGIFKLSKIPLVLLFDKVASNGGGATPKHMQRDAYLISWLSAH